MVELGKDDDQFAIDAPIYPENIIVQEKMDGTNVSVHVVAKSRKYIVDMFLRNRLLYSVDMERTTNDVRYRLSGHLDDKMFGFDTQNKDL